MSFFSSPDIPRIGPAPRRCLCFLSVLVCKILAVTAGARWLLGFQVGAPSLYVDSSQRMATARFENLPWDIFGCTGSKVQ